MKHSFITKNVFYVILHFSCKFIDVPSMATLIEGLRAHSEVEAFPMWMEGGDEVFPNTLKERGVNIEDTWAICFYDLESLQVAGKLLESVPWKDEVNVLVHHYLNADNISTWSLAEFDKAIFVDKLFFCTV